MKILIKKYGDSFAVDPIDAQGSPRMGVGRTMDAALADFLRIYQKELGITEITLDDKATQTELRRRNRELKKR
jgi:hypothetical protein